jgi:hypothetical protein
MTMFGNNNVVGAVDDVAAGKTVLFGVVVMLSVRRGGVCGGWGEFEAVWAAGRGRRTAAESLMAGVLNVGLRGDERMVWRVMLWGYDSGESWEWWGGVRQSGRSPDPDNGHSGEVVGC